MSNWSKEEMETVLVYNYATNEWNVYSNVPKHIRKLQSLGEMKVLETEDNRPVAIKGKLNEKQVSMKQERVLSEEQKAKMSERMRNLRGK